MDAAPSRKSSKSYFNLINRKIHMSLCLCLDKDKTSICWQNSCESPPLRYRGRECFQLKGTFTCHRASLKKFTWLFRLFCEFFSFSLFEMQRHNRQQSKSTFPGAWLTLLFLVIQSVIFRHRFEAIYIKSEAISRG